jgi:hypothetical protein
MMVFGVTKRVGGKGSGQGSQRKQHVNPHDACTCKRMQLRQPSLLSDGNCDHSDVQNRRRNDRASETYVLIRDDLNTLNVSSGLEDLFEDFLGDSGVQTANVESSLVGLRSGTARTTGTARRVQTIAIVVHGISHGVGLLGALRDVERGVLARSTASRGGSGHLHLVLVVGHFSWT